MGSESDRETMAPAAEILKAMGVAFEWKVISAHRLPERLKEYVTESEKAGMSVFIAGAGGAAHLPGVIASFTVRPVIGVPIHNSRFNGLDSLLSIVNMPRGVPVATMAVGPSGAANGALQAISMLALNDAALETKLRSYRENQRQELERKEAESTVVYDGEQL